MWALLQINVQKVKNCLFDDFRRFASFICKMKIFFLEVLIAIPSPCGMISIINRSNLTN
jgi:hypothetical protein